MAERKRKLRALDEESQDVAIGLKEIQKLSHSLFANDEQQQSGESSPPQDPDLSLLEDVIEVKELRSSEVIGTIEDLVMKFVQQILRDGSCDTLSPLPPLPSPS